MKLVNLWKLGGEWEGEARNSGIILFLHKAQRKLIQKMAAGR